MPCPPARRGSLAGPQRVLPGFPAAAAGGEVCAVGPQVGRFGSDVSELAKRAGTEAEASMPSRPPPPPPPSLKLPAGQRVRSWPWAKLPAGIAPRHPRPAPSRRLLPPLTPGSARGQRCGAGAARQAPLRTPDRLRGHLRGTVPRRSLLAGLLSHRCYPEKRCGPAGREDAGSIPPPVAVGCWWEPGRAACKPEPSLGGEPYSYLLTFPGSTYVVPVLLSADFYSRLARHRSYLICGSLLGLAI